MVVVADGGGGDRWWWVVVFQEMGEKKKSRVCKRKISRITIREKNKLSLEKALMPVDANNP